MQPTHHPTHHPTHQQIKIQFSYSLHPKKQNENDLYKYVIHV